MNLRQKSLLLVLLGIVNHVNAEEIQATEVTTTSHTPQAQRISQAEPKLAEKQYAKIPVRKSNFEGWAFLGSVGYSMNKMKYDSRSGQDKADEKRVSTQVGIEYGIPVGERFLATVGMTYGLNDIEFEKVNIKNLNANIVQAKLKNRFSFYVAPGFEITPDWLVYGKVAYQHAKGTYSDDYKTLGGVEFGKGSKSFSGIGYGLGTAISLFPNVENSLEVQHISYDKQEEFITTGKASITEVMASLKYRF